MPLLNFLKVIVLPVFRTIKPFRVYGEKKVGDGACVYICNHYQVWDIVYPAVTTSEGIHYVAKNQVFKMPVIGTLARWIKAICVNRDGKDVRGLLDCIKCLKNNEKICIFPEGTRNRTDSNFLPFQQGAAAMAIKCKAPIIPIVIYKKPKVFRMTHILIGKAFELTEFYDRKLSEEEVKEAENKLFETMSELRKNHTEFLQNRKKGKK